jgi:hypothetical protein
LLSRCLAKHVTIIIIIIIIILIIIIIIIIIITTFVEELKSRRWLVFHNKNA